MENAIRVPGLAIAKCARVMEKNDGQYFLKIALGVKVLELAPYVKVPDNIRFRESIPYAEKKFTITCVKGKLTKKVTAVNPKCPAGYKLKK